MVQASEILAKIKRGGPVKYDGVIVVGDLNLSWLDLPTKHVERSEEEIIEGLTEDVKVVKSSISIKDSEIRGSVNLDNTIFQETVNFWGTNFSRNADFRGASFTGVANFGGANFSGEVNFRKANFIGIASFWRVNFSGNAHFRRANFSGNATFWGANFSRKADFRKANFSGDASFWEAYFNGDAYFKGANFSRGAIYFQRVEFSGNIADFGEARFSGEANFAKAKFNSNVTDFEKVEFSGGAHFLGAEFRGGDADFVRAEFNGDADFSDAQFTGGDANFITARFAKRANVSRAKFSNKLIIDWIYIKSTLDVALFPTLIRHYKDLSWFEDADDCYYQYRKIRRRSKPLTSRIPDIIAQISHGYWVKPMYPLMWSIFVIIVFGLIFFNMGDDYITKYSTQDIYEVSNIENHTTTTLIKTNLIEERRILKRDYFFFSMETFSSGLTSFLYPSTEFKANGLCKNLAIIEHIFGIVLIAFFFYAYGRTIRRG